MAECLNNLPVDHTWKLGADIVIAVDVEQDPAKDTSWEESSNHKRNPFTTPSFLRDFYRAEMIMIRKMTEEKLTRVKPTILLHPKMSTSINMLTGFTKAKENHQRQAKKLQTKPLTRSNWWSGTKRQ